MTEKKISKPRVRSGFLMISRSMMDHWLFSDISRWGAFIALLFLANYANSQELVGNTIAEVPRGSFVTSERELGRILNWVRSRVRRFLSLLEENQEITRKSIQGKGTMITLLKYEQWQGLVPDDESSVGSESTHWRTNLTSEDNGEKQGVPPEDRPADGPLTAHSISQERINTGVDKAIIKEKGNNKYIRPNPSENHEVTDTSRKSKRKRKQKVFPRDSVEFGLAQFLSECLTINNSERTPTSDKDLQSWAYEIDKLVRLDGRNLREIGEIITWCQADFFWHQNIQSAFKLRQQFDQLVLNRKADKKVPGKRRRVGEIARDEIIDKWEKFKEQLGLLNISEKIDRLPDRYRPDSFDRDDELKEKYDYLKENEPEIYESFKKYRVPSLGRLRSLVMNNEKPSDREWELRQQTKFFPELYEEYISKYGHPNKQEEDAA